MVSDQSVNYQEYKLQNRKVNVYSFKNLFPNQNNIFPIIMLA